MVRSQLHFPLNLINRICGFLTVAAKDFQYDDAQFYLKNDQVHHFFVLLLHGLSSYSFPEEVMKLASFYVKLRIVAIKDCPRVSSAAATLSPHIFIFPTLIMRLYRKYIESGLQRGTMNFKEQSLQLLYL